MLTNDSANVNIITLTLNPAIDRTVTLANFAYGQVNRAETSSDDMGGKGINVARMLNICGCRVMACGLLGSNGQTVTEALMSRESFPASWLTVPGKTRTNTKLVTTHDQLTTDINEPGFDLESISNKLLDKLNSKVGEWAAECDTMVFAGSIPPGLPDDTYGQLIRSCKQANPECFTVVDSEGKQLQYAVEAGADMIKPNLAELASLMTCNIKEYENIAYAINHCKQLIKQYSLTTILLSNGPEGSILLYRSSEEVESIDILRSGALDVMPRSTTGAGDSLLAGYLAGRSAGLDQEHSLAKGTACAALAVTRQSWQQIDVDMIAKYEEKALKLIKFS